jgi:hypothetical protein
MVARVAFMVAHMAAQGQRKVGPAVENVRRLSLSVGLKLDHVGRRNLSCIASMPSPHIHFAFEWPFLTEAVIRRRSQPTLKAKLLFS